MKAAACVVLALAPLAAWAVAPEGQARHYEVEMTECLDRSVSSEDRVLLSKWIFSVILLHPELRSLTSESQADREQLMRKVAALHQRLIAEDCRKEMIDVVKFEGPESLRRAFGHLGTEAVRQILADPAVKRGMKQSMRYIDQEFLLRRLLEGPAPGAH